MKKKIKRVISLLLVFVMVFSLNTNVLADENENTVDTTNQVEENTEVIDNEEDEPVVVTTEDEPVKTSVEDEPAITLTEGEPVVTSVNENQPQETTNNDTSNAVAKVGQTSYNSLQEAINEANGESNVVLQNDVVEDITVAGDKIITLDLNGYNITGTGSSNKPVINNDGSFTLIDSQGNGKVYNPENSSYYTIKNQGTMILGTEDGTNDFSIIEKSSDNTSSLVENGWYYAKDKPADVGEVSMTIYGGTFEGNANTSNIVKNDEYGVLGIKMESLHHIVKKVVHMLY